MKANLILIFILIASFSKAAQAVEVLDLNAKYTIPVTKDSELPYSTFDLKNYKVTLKTLDNTQEVQLTYTLPKEMVGVEKEITLNLVANMGSEKILAGPEASAKCSGKWIQMKCEVRFHDLEIDLLKVEEVLKELGLSESEIRSRVDVLAKFSGDPIGFSEVVGN
jgi:hypothetical protein